MKEINLDVFDVVRFKLGGKSWDVSKPTMRQVKNFELQSKLKDADEIDVNLNFISELGLPRDIIEDFTIDQLMLVVNALMPNDDVKKSLQN